jgi:sugar phosphate isomerase/epimerase
MFALSRRAFLTSSALAGSGLATSGGLTTLLARSAWAARRQEPAIAFGLVTYMWGADWDLPTLLENCRKTNVLGVELRTTHAHKVEPDLNERQRAEVAARFADSGVTCVGIGSDERLCHPDPELLQRAKERCREFIRLSHDIGGGGVKVKPNDFHPGVPREKTIEQIGKALNELGEYAAGYGQQIRLEVHGKCAELPTIQAIMEVATHDNVYVCWNSNKTDLAGDGLEKNFHRVRARFGSTCHVRELDSPDYPFQELIRLLVTTRWEGWMLLEASSKPADRVAALARQRELFDTMLRKALEA